MKKLLKAGDFTSLDFFEIFNKRREQLISDLDLITVEEARVRYKNLWSGCPTELHIDEFTIVKLLENKFPDFHIEGVTRKTYTISVTNHTSNEELEQFKRIFLP
jgi:hypothetical protein